MCYEAAKEEAVMNRIVREHYPVKRLPAELRIGLASDAYATVLVEVEGQAKPARSLADIDALRRPTYRNLEDIVSEVRAFRDEEEP